MDPRRDPAAAAKTAALLKSLWERNLPMLRDRLAQLDRAATLALDNHLTPSLRSDAAMTAHKLAGSLGTFGYPEGTRIARALEQLLDAPEPPHPPHLARLTRELRAALNLDPSA